MPVIHPGGTTPPSGPIELAGQVLCTSDDLDEVVGAVNDVFYPARLEPVGASARLSHPWLSAVHLSHLTIGVVHFGAEMLVEPGDLGGYHVNVPLSGAVVSRCGAQYTVATPSRAAVFAPNAHTVLPSWSAEATQICIKIERATLEAELARILGRPVDQRVRFDIGFDIARPAGRRWYSTLQLLIDVLNDAGAHPDAALAAQVGYLERALIVGLLAGHGHSMSEALHCDVADRNPAAVTNVVDLIREAPGAQHTIADLAQSAGVGVRQLQKLFQDRFAMSPSEYLRNVRLDGVRSQLLADTDSATVSDVAYRWGFNHLGRFAYYYRRKFGESPSQTLRSGRAR